VPARLASFGAAIYHARVLLVEIVHERTARETAGHGRPRSRPPGRSGARPSGLAGRGPVLPATSPPPRPTRVPAPLTCG